LLFTLRVLANSLTFSLPLSPTLCGGYEFLEWVGFFPQTGQFAKLVLTNKLAALASANIMWLR